MRRTLPYCLLTTAGLWIYISIAIPSFALPVCSTDPAGQVAQTVASSEAGSLPALVPPQGALTEVENPFDKFVSTAKDASAGNPNTFGAIPAAYPAKAPYPSGNSRAHFEIEGFAQWKNILASGGVSTGNGGNIALRNDLGIGDLVAGPLVRGIWTPEFEMLGATSKFWVEYGQINRSRTRNISGTIIFGGHLYVVDSTIRTELRTKQFELGYAPRWGNSKFRIGPSFIYERMNVDFILTNLSPGAPPPITQEANVPNNIFLVGADFDYMPSNLFDIYGHVGVLPCCGGGWHIFESEFGTKYYFARNFSVMGGVRYSYLRLDFELPAISVGNVTAGPFPGSLKFAGVGPFVGASWRF